MDVENKIFGQAQSKKEYLGMVASLIIHIRGISEFIFDRFIWIEGKSASILNYLICKILDSIVGSQPEPKAELNQDDQQQETEDAIMALENISLQNVFPWEIKMQLRGDGCRPLQSSNKASQNLNQNLE